MAIINIVVNLSSCREVTKGLGFGEANKIITSYLPHLKGDTLYFLDDSNNIDTLVVTNDDAYMFFEPTSSNIFGRPKEDTVSLTKNVQMKGRGFSLKMYMAYTKEQASASFCIVTDSTQQYKVGTQIVELDKLEDDFSFTNGLDHTCLFHKGEGLVMFTDENGKSWTRKMD